MNKVSLIISTCIILAIFLLIIFFHTHGSIPYDEGWFIQAGKRILEGDKIYKDFEFLYNPGGAYLNTIAFKIFGESIISSRIFAILNSSLAVFLIYYIFKKIKLNGLTSIILIISFIFWGAGHINFIWPVVICLTLGLFSTALFLKSADDKNKAKLFFLIGFISAATFIFKQNFGLAIFLSDLIIFALIKEFRNIKMFSCFFAGLILILLLQVLYFLYLGNLTDYFQDIYFYTFVKIYKEGILNSLLPWDYPAPIIIRVLKFIFYTSPLTLSIFTFFRLLKLKNKNLLYFPIISISYFMLSIRPTTDYVHLTPLFAFSVINIGIIYKSLNGLGYKISYLLLILVFCALGGYSAFFKNYYRWNSPIIKQNIFSNNPKALIWHDDKENQNISELSKYFNENIKNEEYLFIYNFSPMYYLILDKKNPTHFDYLHAVMTKEFEIDTVNNLKRKKLKHILTNVNLDEYQTIIAKFIKKNYKIIKQVNEYSVWELK